MLLDPLHKTLLRLCVRRENTGQTVSLSAVPTVKPYPVTDKPAIVPHPDVPLDGNTAIPNATHVATATDGVIIVSTSAANNASLRATQKTGIATARMATSLLLVLIPARTAHTERGVGAVVANVRATTETVTMCRVIALRAVNLAIMETPATINARDSITAGTATEHAASADQDQRVTTSVGCVQGTTAPPVLNLECAKMPARRAVGG